MNMVKTLIATSVLAGMAMPALANADVYGKVNVSVQSSDDGNGAVTELKSNASRFGIKGSQKLEGKLSVVYKYEFQVDVTDNSKSSADHIKSRNQYIGLKGSFGEILLGRNDTVLKQSQGKVDLFSDNEADIKAMWKGENRMDDTITYKSPKFNGVQFAASYILDEENDDASTSVAAMYGDKNLKKGKYYAAIAMDSEVKGYDTTRVTFATKLGAAKLGFMYQTQEDIETGADKSGLMASVNYKMDKYDLKGQYQTLEDDAGFSLGADRKLGKQTKVYAFYTTFTPDMGEDEAYIAVGLEQKF